jgi:predicted O-linked N-acetylglucosamine transferase (SPINDLY family)
VLTRAGQTFASRMAGALLTAAELPELVTTDLAAYEAKAVQLAHAPTEIQRLKAHLQQVRDSGTLFDTPRFVGHLEQTLERLVGNAASAEPVALTGVPMAMPRLRQLPAPAALAEA